MVSLLYLSFSVYRRNMLLSLTPHYNTSTRLHTPLHHLHTHTHTDTLAFSQSRTKNDITACFSVVLCCSFWCGPNSARQPFHPQDQRLRDTGPQVEHVHLLNAVHLKSWKRDFQPFITVLCLQYDQSFCNSFSSKFSWDIHLVSSMPCCHSISLSLLSLFLSLSLSFLISLSLFLPLSLSIFLSLSFPLGLCVQLPLSGRRKPKVAGPEWSGG